MSNVKRIISQAYHRNGVGGAPGIITLFETTDAPGTFLAITVLPDRPQNKVYFDWRDEPRDAYIDHWLDDFARHTVVVNLEMTVAGNIAFAAGNSWRGADAYGPAIAQYYREHNSLFGDPALERYEEEYGAADPS